MTAKLRQIGYSDYGHLAQLFSNTRIDTGARHFSSSSDDAPKPPRIREFRKLDAPEPCARCELPTWAMWRINDKDAYPIHTYCCGVP